MTGQQVTATVIYAAVIPDEPPIGTIVIDNADRAWQRRVSFTSQHWAGVEQECRLSWLFLLSRGPVTEVYRPAK